MWTRVDVTRDRCGIACAKEEAAPKQERSSKERKRTIEKGEERREFGPVGEGQPSKHSPKDSGQSETIREVAIAPPRSKERSRGGARGE